VVSRAMRAFVRPSLALALAVGALAGCAHPVEETLEAVKRADALPVPLTLVYDERSAVLGGQRIELDGDGTLVRRRWRPGFAPALDAPETLLGEPEDEAGEADAVARATLPVEAVRELADLLFALEAWEQEADEDALGRVDDSRTRLVLTAREGESTIWEYSQDRARLQRVKLALEGLMTRFASE
jgi:hypothetical protein